jgi:5'-3' exonuclease
LLVSGVPGIGPKIAVALLEQFGSVTKMLENLSQIESVVRRERYKKKQQKKQEISL